MRRALVRRGIVVEEPIDVIEPAALLFHRLFSDQPLNMAFAKNASGFRDTLGAIAILLVNDLGKPLEIEPAVDKHGDSPYAHLQHFRETRCPKSSAHAQNRRAGVLTWGG